jgi:thiamine kinase-like enzyme
MPAAASLLPAAELDQARARVRALAEITTAVKVPCHRDYTPRNWLVHDDGLAVIDFEWARLDAPASDLARLHLGIWADRSDLAEAFADGYGQPPSDTDRVIPHGCAAITAIWLTIKARETSQPSFEQSSRAALTRLLAQN